MIKKVIHDPIFLAGKSEMATKEDLQVAQDLLDTLIANKDGCVGMAANMIGVRKRIIVFDNDGTYMTIFTVVFALGTLISQFLFQVISSKFTRAQLIKVSTILLVIGYIIFFDIHLVI